MLYDNYEKKILKVANVLSKIVRVLPLIITVLCVIIVAVIGLLVAKGTVMKMNVPEKIIYGETPICEASAFLSDTKFEYRSASKNEWTEEVPRLSGEYYVRAVAEGSFDSIKYSDEKKIFIEPKPVDVSVSSNNVVYGENPSVRSILEYSDRVECDGFIYDNIVLENTTVSPNADQVSFFDKEGNDVSYCYKVNSVPKEIAIDKRDITITVEDSKKIYDGRSFSYDRYELTEGTLALKDTLVATFELSMIDVGSEINKPTLKIITSDGQDVTHHYRIKEQFGKLEIEVKDLWVYTGGGTAVYDGQKVIFDSFNVESGEAPLVEGHEVVINTTPDIVNAGSYQNLLTFRVLDAQGNDQTHNYNIIVGTGTVEVEKRPITITTESESWIYDGEKHTLMAFAVENLLSGHIIKDTYWSEITNVGIAENKFTPKIYDDIKNTETTLNYDISFVCGTLEITKRPVTVESGTEKLIYNGMPQEIKSYNVVSKLSFAKDDRFVIKKSSSLTDVGSIPNEILECSVLGSSGEDKLGNYDLTFKNGNLTIYPRPIAIAPEYASKIYDDTPLKGENILVLDTKFPLVAGHSITADPVGTRVDVGMTLTSFKNVKIWSGEKEVTHNYQITVENNFIEIFPRPITIETLSANKYYDGIELTMKSSNVNNLVDGHVFSVTYTGSQKEIGKSLNTILEHTIRITSKERDITNNYIIDSITEGILEVKPWATISIATNSDEKKYDGTPLTNKVYKEYIIDGAMKKGHSLVVQVTGSQTAIGQSDNTAYYCVKDEYGGDVSKYYVIELSMGILEVYDKKEPTSFEEYPVAKIKPNVSGSIYLKQFSYGSYTGSTNWGAAPSYTKLLSNGQNYNYLTSAALMNRGVVESFAEIEELSVPYMLPTYLGNSGNYNVPNTDTEYYEFYMPEYSMSYYVWPNVINDVYSLKGYLGEFAEQELEYRKYVHEVYMDIDDETREYMENLIKLEGFDINDGTVIFKIASYIQNSAKYNLHYDVTLDEQSNVAIAFLETYKEGICVHYATSATLLYRALGFPARYVTGFLAQNLQADQWNDVTTPGHAWVEVYIDGVGWVQVEVTGGYEGHGVHGGNGSGPFSFEITPKYQYKVYDGKYLYAENELEMSDDLMFILDMGFTYSVTVEGKQLEVGTGVSKISSFEIYDSFGNNVTAEFVIIYNDGILEVIPDEPIKIYLYEIQKIYDGLPLEFEPDEYEILSIKDGLDLELDLIMSLTDVGMLSIGEINLNSGRYVSYRVLDGGKDVTDMYRVIFDTIEGTPDTYIPIRIIGRPIEVSSMSESKSYDGTPLTNETVEITKGALVNGHKLQANAIGSIIGVGEETNYIETIMIVDSEGKDVTGNYTLYINEGTLTIIDPDN